MLIRTLQVCSCINMYFKIHSYIPFFFRFLAKVNPRTGIPVIATVISGVFSAILALIFNLHALVEMASIGALLAYTMVAVCVLILRYQPRTVGLTKRNISEISLSTHMDGTDISREDSPLLGEARARKPTQRTAFLALVAIVASCIGFAGVSALIIWASHDLSQAKWWAISLVTLIGLLPIGSIILLFRLPQNKTPLPFMVPCVPVLPLLSVFINVFLILKLSYLTWIRFAVWMVLGEFAFQCTLNIDKLGVD